VIFSVGSSSSACTRSIQAARLAGIDEQCCARADRGSLDLAVRSFTFVRNQRHTGIWVLLKELAAAGPPCKFHQISAPIQGAADLAFAALVEAHAAIGEHEAGHAGGARWWMEVLHPGEVLALPSAVRVLPAHVVVLAEQSESLKGGLANVIPPADR